MKVNYSNRIYINMHILEIYIWEICIVEMYIYYIYIHICNTFWRWLSNKGKRDLERGRERNLLGIKNSVVSVSFTNMEEMGEGVFGERWKSGWELTSISATICLLDIPAEVTINKRSIQKSNVCLFTSNKLSDNEHNLQCHQK